MFCPKCGNQLNDGAAFCPKCGERITDNTSIKENNNTGLISAIKPFGFAIIAVACCFLYPAGAIIGIIIAAIGLVFGIIGFRKDNSSENKKVAISSGVVLIVYLLLMVLTRHPHP